MIAVSWPIFYAILYAHWAIFIVAPIALFRAGWPVSGGLIMLLSTLMPIAGQVWFTNSDAPGLVFLLMIEVTVGMLVLLAGVAVKVVAFVREQRKPSL